MLCKKSLKIPKGYSESVYQRIINNKMAKGKGTNNDLQNINSIPLVSSNSSYITCNFTHWITLDTRSGFKSNNGHGFIIY
jgi:hypothetical protein